MALCVGQHRGGFAICLAEEVFGDAGNQPANDGLDGACA